ncbi:MAG TPA: 5-oxoprolinase/urea amidolyase family protein [Bryobacteraceae bacterium]|nr:5-oxoprolinase/urea amidolyase family protein [Bryobacteraceae bacterium]
MFTKVLIANRGAIATRIIRTLRNMGVGSVAIHSDADAASLFVRQADQAVSVGGPRGYLDIDAVLAAAKASGAQAIHPGYGFLSENASFAEACEQAGLQFIGPTPDQMRDFGLKHRARELAQAAGVAMLPGTGLLERAADAAVVGFPLMLKSTAGGGGIGMRVCHSPEELEEAFAAIERLSKTNFKDSGIYAERFVEKARHIEVQIFGDGNGRVVALGERDCSAQRRNQKVVEETPAPGLSDNVRTALLASAVRLGERVKYRNAGTVEFIYDEARGEFYFLEVNTRLQVEHGVTEEVTGVDLVEWMVRLAAGENPISPVEPQGASIQVRVYAESPLHDFRPCAGPLSHVSFPSDARIETWVESGSEVSTFYDPLLAKIIVKGDTRAEAVAKLTKALAETSIFGIETNLDYLAAVCGSEAFAAGAFPTSLLRGFPYETRAIEVLEPGTQTTVQDYPGRLGYWHIGVPPSGPIDDKAFRIANEIVGNAPDAAGLEMSLIGPALHFHHDAVIAATGADMGIPRWEPLFVKAGEVIRFTPVSGAGARGYLAIRGGIDVPSYLGSKSTFILGKFGGRHLRAGDLLRFGTETAADPKPWANPPEYGKAWEIGVTYGPHGAPDFFTNEDIDMFFAQDWRVHYNSDRTGIRLIGPKPQWARKDGGEAGLHPSNIHDNAYAVGTIDFTGDMPIILGPDGPSCGGFVCPATIVKDELWKMGQLKAGDTVRFVRVNNEPAILRGEAPGVVIRADGDRNLLVEFGPNQLDFELSFAAHSLRRQLEGTPGIIDLTPGIRSLQIHYDAAKLPRQELFERIDEAQAHPLESVPSRKVHLPLSWDDPATRLAIEKYMQGVRADAPWCPWNIEFIRRINGLESVDDVFRTVFEASWLTLALGDVYLGAPVATPIDPRHRLVTTKYNPARTWTAENSVGIGGAYLCVYGMEGPGGYQFVGRTTQMWKTHRQPKPWLLDFFDRLQFYPVSAAELLEMRADPNFTPRIEEGEFSLVKHREFLQSIEAEALAFQTKRDKAFREERDRWGEYIAPPLDDMPPPPEDALPDGATAVRSPIAASVWSVPVETGQQVKAGDRLLVLEAMKMELAITAPAAGELLEMRCAPGALVQPGQVLAVLR